MQNEVSDQNTKNPVEACCKAGDSKENEDYLVKCIGGFGLWQAKVCFLASFARFIAMWNMVGYIFLTYDTEFDCVSFNGSSPTNVTPSTCYESCLKYEVAEGLFVKSFVAEFELICGRSWMASFAQTVMMFGLMFGVSLFGWISDRFGRRTSLLLSAFLNVSLMVATPFSPNYWVFLCLRFLIGFTTGGVLIVGIVVVLEVVGPKHRDTAGCLATLPDGLAEASLVIFSYFSPTWRLYLLALSVASAFVLIFLPMISESPRWLVSKGRTDDARKLIAHAAKCNNLDVVAVEENLNRIVADISTNDNTTPTSSTYCSLFKTKKLAVRTLCSCFVWAVCGVSFFGINQYTTFLGSNVFISVVILGLMQVPTLFIAIWLNKVFGRKSTTIGTLVLTGVTMFILIFVPPDHWSAVFLAITGSSSISTTFCIVYVYTSELFPTTLRNMAFGLSAAGAKIGAMVAPFVATLSPIWVPSLIFAVLPLMAAGICFILPETKEKRLEDHIE